MTSEALADLHAESFSFPRPWSASEFSTLLANPHCFLTTSQSGFAVGRQAGPEAELLTMLIRPDMRRSGLGAALLKTFVKQAKRRGVAELFLEVAKTNTAAISLYSGAGFEIVGERKAYYRQLSGPRISALILKRLI